MSSTFEVLEDRTLLAVTNGNIADAIKGFQTELDLAFDEALKQTNLDAQIPVFSKKLSQMFDLATLTDTGVDNVVNFLNANISPVSVALTSLPGGLISATNINISNVGDVTFDLKFAFSVVNSTVNVSPSIDFAGIKISLPNNLAFQFQTAFTATTRIAISDATPGNTSDLVTVKVTPDKTMLTFGATFASGSLISINGNVAQVLKYRGKIGFNYNPSVSVAFSGATPIPLGSLGQKAAPAVKRNVSTIQVPIEINLDSRSGPAKFLPPVGYKAKYAFDITAPSIPTDVANSRFVLFNGNEIEANNAGLQRFVIDNYATKVVGQVAEIIPNDLAAILLGTKEVFGSLKINDLIGVGIFPNAVYNSPIALFQVVGVPGPVIQFIKTLLKTSNFIDTPNPTAAQAKEIGLSFPIAKDPIVEVFKLMRGDTAELVKWKVTVVEELLKYYNLDLGKIDKLQAMLPHIEGLTLTVTREQLKVTVDPAKMLQGLVARLGGKVGKTAADILSFLVKHAPVTGNINLMLSGQVAAGADTNFLTQGGLTLNDVADTFYLDTTEPLLNVGVHVEVTANLAEALGGGGLGLTNFSIKPPKTLSDLGKGVENVLTETKKAVENPAGAAKRAIQSAKDYVDDAAKTLKQAGINFDGLDSKVKGAIGELREGVGVIQGELTVAGENAMRTVAELGEQGWDILKKLVGDLLGASITIGLDLEAKVDLMSGAEPGKLRATEIAVDKVCLAASLGGEITARSNFLGTYSAKPKIEFSFGGCKKLSTTVSGGPRPAHTKLLWYQGLASGSRRSIRTFGVSWRDFLCLDAA